MSCNWHISTYSTPVSIFPKPQFSCEALKECYLLYKVPAADGKGGVHNSISHIVCVHDKVFHGIVCSVHSTVVFCVYAVSA